MGAKTSRKAKKIKGVIPKFGELFRQSATLVESRRPPLIFISVILVLGMLLPSVIEQFIGTYIAGSGLVVAIIVIELLFFGIIIYASIAAICTLHGKKVLTASQAFEKAQPYFWPTVWVNILVIFLVVGAMIPLVIPAIVVSITATFITFTVVLDGKEGLDALLRSKHLVTGRWSNVFARTFSISVVLWILPLIVGAIAFGIIGGITQAEIIAGLGGIDLLLIALAALYVIAYAYPMTLAYMYVLYANAVADRPASTFEPRDLKPGLYKFLIGWGAILALVIGVVSVVSEDSDQNFVDEIVSEEFGAIELDVEEDDVDF